MLCIFTIYLPQTIAANKTVAVIINEDTASYREFLSRLIQRSTTYTTNGVRIIPVLPNEISSVETNSVIDNSDVIVLTGADIPTETSSHNNKAMRISTLVTREQYINLISNQEYTSDCATVIDQPFGRQFKSIRKAFPNTKTIGIITSSNTRKYLMDIEKSAKKYKFNIVHETVSNNIHNTIRKLAALGAEGILAVPDTKVYNSSSARNILISSYHLNLPIYGYSSSFVRAGALMGIYSTPASLADQVYNIILNPESCRSQNIIYPTEYIMEINPHVAESLNLKPIQSKMRILIEDESLYE